MAYQTFYMFYKQVFGWLKYSYLNFYNLLNNLRKKQFVDIID